MIVGGIEVPLPGSRSWLEQHRAGPPTLVQAPLHWAIVLTVLLPVPPGLGRWKPLGLPALEKLRIYVKMGNREAGGVMDPGFGLEEWQHMCENASGFLYFRHLHSEAEERTQSVF